MPALDILVGPGAGGTLALDDLERLADWYDHPQPATGRDSAVRATMVSSVDGAASADGRSGPLGDVADKAVFRVLRGVADVVLVGAGTARTENYGPASVPDRLAAWRRDRGLAPAPVVVQVTRSGHVHEGRGMFDGAGRAAVVTSSTDPQVLDRLRRLAGGDGVITAPAPDGSGVDITAALAGLAARGWRRVLCEGGPSLLARVAAADAVDEWCLTTAPLAVPVAAPRITQGTGSAPPVPLRLAGLLRHDSTLLARWRPAGATH